MVLGAVFLPAVVFCRFPNLERAFPVYRRIMKGGIVDFPVESAYNPYTVGCSNYQSGDLTKPDRADDGIFGFGQDGLSVVSQLPPKGFNSNF
uniref:Uncharacterized protein n=1 Tax=Nelumbo nucifera TaxID=4432 RepID=A0A823A135_NELNU|nr:TPA_asm: hypothetical protein HUJ06_018673 [Nelumbo nucifera]